MAAGMLRGSCFLQVRARGWEALPAHALATVLWRANRASGVSQVRAVQRTPAAGRGELAWHAPAK